MYRIFPHSPLSDRRYIKTFHAKSHQWILSLRAELISVVAALWWLLTGGLSLPCFLFTATLVARRRVHLYTRLTETPQQALKSLWNYISSYFELHVNETCHSTVGNVTCHLHVCLRAASLAGSNKPSRVLLTCTAYWQHDLMGSVLVKHKCFFEVSSFFNFGTRDHLFPIKLMYWPIYGIVTYDQRLVNHMRILWRY